MELNGTVIIIVIVLAAGLIVFLIRRNQKDQKEMEQELNATDKAGESESNDEEERG